VCYSFIFSILVHALVFKICKSLIKNRTLFNIIILIVSVLILALNIGFYVGVKNWGSPVNIDLVKAGFSDFSSVVTIAFHNYELIIATIVGIVVVYYFYHRNSKSLFSIQNQIQNSVKSYLVIAIKIFAIIGMIFIYPVIAKSKKGVLKDEIYFSFFKKSSSLQRIDELELGVDNIAKSYPVIKNFDKKNVILF